MNYVGSLLSVLLSNRYQRRLGFVRRPFTWFREGSH
jgi:hypothetical protein